VVSSNAGTISGPDCERSRRMRRRGNGGI